MESFSKPRTLKGCVCHQVIQRKKEMKGMCFFTFHPVKSSRSLNLSSRIFHLLERDSHINISAFISEFPQFLLYPKTCQKRHTSQRDRWSYPPPHVPSFILPLNYRLLNRANLFLQLLRTTTFFQPLSSPLGSLFKPPHCTQR